MKCGAMNTTQNMTSTTNTENTANLRSKNRLKICRAGLTISSESSGTPSLNWISFSPWLSFFPNHFSSYFNPKIQRTNQRARMRNTFSFFFMRIPPYLLMRTRGSTMP